MTTMKLILGICFLTLSLPAFAETGPRGDRKGAQVSPEKMHQKMMKVRSKMLKEKLGFDARTVQQIEEVLRNFDPKRHELHKKMHQGRQQIRALLESDSNVQQAYEEALRKMRAAHKGLNELRTGEMDQLAEILSPKQQARLTQTLMRLKRKMHKIRKRMHKGKGDRVKNDGSACAEDDSP